MKLAFTCGLTVATVGLAGCSAVTGLQDCNNLRSEIIAMTEEDRASRGYALIKIREPKTISNTDKQISCSGQAIWTDGDTTGINYKNYIDEDGDVMIEYQPI